MERYLELFQKANDYFKTADHLAYVTYELVQEPKLLLTILDNLNLALKHKTDSLLEYERLYKRISPIPQNQELKLLNLKFLVIIIHFILQSRSLNLQEMELFQLLVS